MPVQTLAPRGGMFTNAAAAGRIGDVLARYGLIVVIGWIGAMKFTTYEPRAFSRS